jgi:phage I-like protein
MLTGRPIIQHLLLLVVMATAPLVALTLYDDVYARIERQTQGAEASLVDAAEQTAFDAERFVRLGEFTVGAPVRGTRAAASIRVDTVFVSGQIRSRNSSSGSPQERWPNLGNLNVESHVVST